MAPVVSASASGTGEHETGKLNFISRYGTERCIPKVYRVLVTWIYLLIYMVKLKLFAVIN